MRWKKKDNKIEPLKYTPGTIMSIKTVIAKYSKIASKSVPDRILKEHTEAELAEYKGMYDEDEYSLDTVAESIVEALSEDWEEDYEKLYARVMRVLKKIA